MKRKPAPAQVAETPAAYGQTDSDIVLYRTDDGKTDVKVRLERESVWLTQRQMADLFAKDTDTIGLHIRNVFREGELEEAATTEESSVVQSEGGRQVRRQIRFYNLDVIISVGYRVKSLRGTKFRIWATGVLREHILQGYTINQRRLQQLHQAIRLVATVADRRDLKGGEAAALLWVVADYSRALDLLDDYDHQRVRIPKPAATPALTITDDEARRLIRQLRTHFNTGELFGREKDGSLAGSLNGIMQTFDGRDVYPGIEAKAAHLLYFLVKNHSFVDGNKRIAAALFLWFLEKNHVLYRDDGSKRIADNALVAMTLMIAESRPADKEILVNILLNLISREEQS